MMHLVGVPASPWSERARWVLDHHRIPHRFTSYAPILDEPWLRVLSRTPMDRLTLPVLRDGSQVIAGSFEVALHGERAGTGPRLVPDISTVIRWNKLSDLAIAAGRTLVARRIVGDDAALAESLPERVPGPLRSLMVPFARARARALAGKHGLDPEAARVAEVALRRALEELRTELAARGRHLLGGRFSYADIAMATALQRVCPPAAEHAHLGAAGRAVRTQPVLVDDFGDLLAWRDEIYAGHRARAMATPPEEPQSRIAANTTAPRQTAE
jgi:glutathione S-transferase